MPNSPQIGLFLLQSLGFSYAQGLVFLPSDGGQGRVLVKHLILILPTPKTMQSVCPPHPVISSSISRPAPTATDHFLSDLQITQKPFLASWKI
jgi:hypothetical protein